MPTDLRTPISSLQLAHEGTSKRSGITRLTVDIPSSHRPQVEAGLHNPPRWRTPEFFVYGAFFCVVVPIMVWIPVQLSSSEHPNFNMYRRKLSPGWISGRYVDNSDAQYRSFRSNTLPLIFLSGAFFGLKLLYSRSLRRVRLTGPSNNSYLVPFLALFSLIMLAGLHGASVLKVLVILSANYALAKTCGSSPVGPVLSWIFNIAILFANEKNEGYRFTSLHTALEILDRAKGIYPRWHISFNITMLRLISFSLDYYWACKPAGLADPGGVLNEKQRGAIAHPLQTYSFVNYIAYALYPPLYIAGPIMTFNDFMWQVIHRPVAIPLRRTLNYLLRFAICFFMMELILHFMYVVAIKDAKAWSGYSAAQLCMIGFWNLIVVWLKLLIPWRFFRLWALVDGIDPPENMVRCMANNYSALGFWRSWHRSYNLWIEERRMLLAWGWLVSLFILPEIIARFLLPPARFGTRPWYRHVCAIGAVFNILMMMSANLVGFVIGTDGISYMLHQVLDSWEGIRFLAFACTCLFVGVQVMFEYREEELRNGIIRRC
ncbi:uncharacterized protein FIBRA_06386 [Fibroporia radiculosa]|uniref:Glycerol transporter n=1 Tax=Fibroporia radiculosa TaxID=599839 RepID=J4H418_9APHY|nr:uncharacterized protein FIBRA_06386 [Fibroporia radiculosa]CCM04219.1 predicted protein [Fibroporia radiculosa]